MLVLLERMFDTSSLPADTSQSFCSNVLSLVVIDESDDTFEDDKFHCQSEPS